MSLRDKLGATTQRIPTVGDLAPEATGVPTRAYQDTKAHIHQVLLGRLNLEAMENLTPEALKEELRHMVERLLLEENLVLNASERRNLVRDIQYEMLGFGPLEPLLVDSTVSDILVNTFQRVYVERQGRLELTDIRFTDDDHLMKIIDKIVSRVGRRIDESSPMVDARLPDGSRVNAIIPPLAIDGPILSIRRFATIPLKVSNLIEYRSLSDEMAQFIGALAQAKINILISGGTGSGKTTLLNILSAAIGMTERIVTIEDAAELQLQQPHVVRLETRPPNIEGRGEVAQRALVRNALRMRPDRIILGETRGAEALDMLQAMNTGHEGSMTTVHANTARDALARLESMIAMAGVDLPAKAARAQVASAIGVIIQVNRMSDGTRKMTSIHEVTGMEGETVTMQEIFIFKQTGVGPSGMVEGAFTATGVRPRCWDRLVTRGIHLPQNIFEPLRREG
ncbi:MAG: pilus assembly protein CpaF [Burkholderiales bacterium RIFCSPLOWO2_12_FULL_61_40]|nr:MAG: pilus assembly protein CpaF [Burkholderiales bacterium RIFCSPLOWO2_12_FULL_61_40]